MGLEAELALFKTLLNKAPPRYARVRTVRANSANEVGGDGQAGRGCGGRRRGRVVRAGMANAGGRGGVGAGTGFRLVEEAGGRRAGTAFMLVDEADVGFEALNEQGETLANYGNVVVEGEEKEANEETVSEHLDGDQLVDDATAFDSSIEAGGDEGVGGGSRVDGNVEIGSDVVVLGEGNAGGDNGADIGEGGDAGEEAEAVVVDEDKDVQGDEEGGEGNEV